MNDTRSGLPRLSADFNKGYTKAIQDMIEVFAYVNNDITGRNMRLNYAWTKKILDCCLENREKIRDNWNGFIRLEKSDSGKWDVVKWYDYKK